MPLFIQLWAVNNEAHSEEVPCQRAVNTQRAEGNRFSIFTRVCVFVCVRTLAREPTGVFANVTERPLLRLIDILADSKIRCTFPNPVISRNTSR